MRLSIRPPRCALAVVALTAAAAWLACTALPDGVGEHAPSAEAARGGTHGAPGGGGTTTSDTSVTVTGVVPDTVTQDTTVDVTVSGAGFDDGSAVTITQNGDPVPGVTTNATRFLNSGTLVANLTMAADAATGTFDVTVVTAHGRKGVGSELLTIKTRSKYYSIPATVTIEESSAYQVSGDGAGTYEGSVGTTNPDPQGILSLSMKSKGKTARCATLSFTLVSGDPANLPNSGCFATHFLTNTRSSETGLRRDEGFFSLTAPGDTAHQGGSVRWDDGKVSWIAVLDPSPSQLAVCDANGVSTADLSPRGDGVLISLLSAQPDGTRTWSVEPEPINGHYYAQMRRMTSNTDNDCASVVELHYRLTVTAQVTQ